MSAEQALLSADAFWDWLCQSDKEDKLYELNRGQIVERSLPGVLHGFVCGKLVYLFCDFLKRRQRGYACCNHTLLLVEENPDTVLGPDLMVFDKPFVKDELSDRYARDVPALIVEVLSPDESVSGMDRRISQFLHRGVLLVWVVDPEAEIVTVCPCGKEPYIADSDAELTGEDVLPDLRFQVAEFFAMPGTE